MKLRLGLRLMRRWAKATAEATWSGQLTGWSDIPPVC